MTEILTVYLKNISLNNNYIVGIVTHKLYVYLIFLCCYAHLSLARLGPKVDGTHISEEAARGCSELLTSSSSSVYFLCFPIRSFSSLFLN